jgi:predicted nucleic acid-binding protein
MREPGRERPFALLDASVVYAGIVGRPDGASATVLATIRLGRMHAFTTENAMEEARRHLLSHFNRNRLKVHSTEADRALSALRDAAAFTVVPWVPMSAAALPGNPKDAYLIEAARRYRPRFLVTNDRSLLSLRIEGATVLTSPAVLLGTLDRWDDHDP